MNKVTAGISASSNATAENSIGTARSVPATPPQAAINRGVVELETDRGSGISVAIAEDLANVVDDGTTRRVLPVVGKGGIGNITDLELLHGIDLAILQDDVMNYPSAEPVPGHREPNNLYRQAL